MSQPSSKTKHAADRRHANPAHGKWRRLGWKLAAKRLGSAGVIEPEELKSLFTHRLLPRTTPRRLGELAVKVPHAF